MILVVAAAGQQGVVLVREHGPEVGQVTFEEHALRERRLAARGICASTRMPGQASPFMSSGRRRLSSTPPSTWNKFRAPYVRARCHRQHAPSTCVCSMAWRPSVHSQTRFLVAGSPHRRSTRGVVFFLAHGRLEGVPVDLGVVRGQGPRPHNKRASARSSRPGASASTPPGARSRCAA